MYDSKNMTNQQNREEWREQYHKIVDNYSQSADFDNGSDDAREEIEKFIQSTRQSAAKEALKNHVCKCTCNCEALKEENLKVVAKEAREEVVKKVIEFIDKKVPDETFGGEFTEGYRAGLHDAKSIVYHHKELQQLTTK